MTERRKRYNYKFGIPNKLIDKCYYRNFKNYLTRKYGYISDFIIGIIDFSRNKLITIKVKSLPHISIATCIQNSLVQIRQYTNDMSFNCNDVLFFVALLNLPLHFLFQ